MKDIKIVNGKAVFPEGIKWLSDKPFDKPEELVEALIPPTVESIEYNAFRGCTSLRSVVIPASVNRIRCDFSTCVSLVSITVDKDNEVYDSREDCNAIIDTVKNELIRGCQTTVIPSSVTSRVKVERMRVYVACDNIWYTSYRQGLDPRSSFSGGTNYASNSPVRTITGGINITF